ncbi:MAG TPA: glutaminyl-peptide cyclotransferase [Anaerolineae bacterium]|jgi:glutamine cyclotransferase
MPKFFQRSSGWVVAVIGLITIIIAVLLLAQPSNRPSPSEGVTAAVPTLAATTTPVPLSTATWTPTFLPAATDTPLPPTSTAGPLPTPVESPGPIPDVSGETPLYTFRIINIYPHDSNAYTQGLIYQDDIFYEGTGLRGQSTLRKVEVETGQVFQLLRLADELFGEGITIFGDRIIQLTWQEHIGFVYDKNSFELQQEFTYPTEGWGLTHDGERLIMSDGTALLYFRDPANLTEIGRVEVFDENGPVILLNELEYINGEVFANIYRTDRIARIDPQTGRVLGWIDLTGLLTPEDRLQPVDVLNGIAYDAEADRLFVTGKLWPKLFEIELIPVE